MLFSLWTISKASVKGNYLLVGLKLLRFTPSLVGTPQICWMLLYRDFMMQGAICGKCFGPGSKEVSLCSVSLLLAHNLGCRYTNTQIDALFWSMKEQFPKKNGLKVWEYCKYSLLRKQTIYSIEVWKVSHLQGNKNVKNSIVKKLKMSNAWGYSKIAK